MKDIIKYYLQLIVLAFCLFTSACSDELLQPDKFQSPTERTYPGYKGKFPDY